MREIREYAAAETTGLRAHHHKLLLLCILGVELQRAPLSDMFAAVEGR